MIAFTCMSIVSHMDIAVYVCMDACMHACMHASDSMTTFIYICLLPDTCMCVCVCVCVCPSRLCVHLSMYASIYVCCV
jgi:hypothetical protein